MSKKWLIGVTTAAAVLAVTALAAVQSQSKGGGSGGGSASSLSGSWQLDASKSDHPGGPGGFRGRSGGRGPEGGRWASGEGRPEGSRGPGRGTRGRRMPDFVRVTQHGGVISFADSAGSVFQEIRTDGSAGAASSDTPGGPRELTGRWEGGTLIAVWSTPWGGTLVQKASLTDHGRTLEIRTERKGDGDGGPRRGRGEMKRVYRRVS